MTKEELELLNKLRWLFDKEAAELFTLHCKVNSLPIDVGYDIVYAIDTDIVYEDTCSMRDVVCIPIHYLIEPTMRKQLEDQVAELEASKKAKNIGREKDRKAEKEARERKKLSELIKKYGVPE